METLRALGALAEPPGEATPRIAAALGLERPPTAVEFSELFAFNLYPYASVYLGAEGMMGGEARDRIAGFFHALGGANAAPTDEPDHLTTLLACQAALAELEATSPAEPIARARRSLFDEHIASWLPAWLLALPEVASPVYQAWGALLLEALRAERDLIGPAGIVPIHHRAAPAVADPRHSGADAFLASLLAPARSGLIITRATLARAAGELGLGQRAGVRRWVLQGLLSQGAEPVLAWLAGEARRWAHRHAAWRDLHGPAAGHWIERADFSARLLLALCRENL